MVKYNRIRILLAERDKNASWLAEQLGRNQSGVNRWCSNQAQPRIPMLYDIARVLEVDVCELLVKGDPEMRPVDDVDKPAL